MGDFKKWGDPSNERDDFEMAGWWYPLTDYGYLTNWKHRTKTAHVYRWWETITSGVSQRSILGPLLFNNELCDLFFILISYDIASCADNNMPYVTTEIIKSVIELLGKILVTIFKWFKDNQMQSNADRYHVLTSTG